MIEDIMSELKCVYQNIQRVQTAMLAFHKSSDEWYDLLLKKAKYEKFTTHLEEILERQRGIVRTNTDRHPEAEDDRGQMDSLD
jgi:hypothetical protein